MFIMMHCGGMPFNGDTINHKSLGGSESAAYYLSRELAAAGHRVMLFTSSPDEGVFDDVIYRHAGKITEQTPLGDRYHTFAVATPHDVNITQRHPAAFIVPTAAKLNLWWLHDLPAPQLRPMVEQNMQRTDAILSVSEWHRQQIIETWHVKPERVINIGNAVDGSLHVLLDHGANLSRLGKLISEEPDGAFRMLYTSRPERGLESLVCPGGIMERLAKAEPLAHLFVCAYDNVTEPMRDYYAWLWRRCDELPNVTNLGNLTKSELAAVMRSCDLLSYPTAFEETSCITAMEAQAAGLPMLTSDCGAMGETCDNSGTVLLGLVPDDAQRIGRMEAGRPGERVDIDAFTQAVVKLVNLPESSEYEALSAAQLEAAAGKTWPRVMDRLLAATRHLFETSPAALCRGLMRVSDIYALQEYIGTLPATQSGPIVNTTDGELAECYAFIESEDWADHYAAYYDYEKARGVDYGPESLEGNDRFEYVAHLVGKLPDGSAVLDYGCAHGHYTMNLARRYPALRFVGLDITPSNVHKARAWASDEGLENVTFGIGQVKGGHVEVAQAIYDAGSLTDWLPGDDFAMVIAGEVLEHVARPGDYAAALGRGLAVGGLMCITTPYGPWEALGYNEHWPWRAHVHHLERDDLQDLFGHMDGFAITVVSSGRTPLSEPIGSYVTQYRKSDDDRRPGEIDYSRKLEQQAPRQTLTACLLVHNAEGTIRRCLESIAPIVDEFVIRVDERTSDDSVRAANKALDDFAPHAPRKIYVAESPLEVGFDVARNDTLDRASGDWVLWVDADEILNGAEALAPKLRANQYDAYIIPQHHFSLEPAGLLKTDLPARLFRRNASPPIRFNGVVHEHPEQKLNEGIEYVSLNPGDVCLSHVGYIDDATRMLRFERNLPLMVRDREKYPDRLLGKFLWIRDLFQLTKYESEEGKVNKNDALARARHCVRLWQDLVESRRVRLVLESLEWYDAMAELLGGRAIKIQINDKAVDSHFYSREHVDALVKLLIDEEL